MYIIFILLNPSIGQIIENIINTSPITNIVYKLNFFPDRLFN